MLVCVETFEDAVETLEEEGPEPAQRSKVTDKLCCVGRVMMIWLVFAGTI